MESKAFIIINLTDMQETQRGRRRRTALQEMALSGGFGGASLGLGPGHVNAELRGRGRLRTRRGRHRRLRKVNLPPLSCGVTFRTSKTENITTQIWGTGLMAGRRLQPTAPIFCSQCSRCPRPSFSTFPQAERIVVRGSRCGAGPAEAAGSIPAVSGSSSS